MTLCRNVILGCSLFIGAIAVVVGIVALTVIEGLINRTMLSRDYLGYETLNGSKHLNSMTEKWIHPDYHMQLQIWMYNLTNMAGVLQGAKPVVQEIGPFTFLERQWKSFHQFDKNDTRILYRNNHVYVFNESLSCPRCSLDEIVVIPNVVFQKLVDFALRGFAYKFAITAAITAIQREGPFINVTVRDALFDGYEDPLLKLVCSNMVVKPLCDQAGIPTRIGFFYGKNNTDDGLYEISTGINNPWTIGKVYSFNNLSEISEGVWDSKDAREIRGTDGQLFPPLLAEGHELEVFAGPMCRSIPMQFRRRSEFKEVTVFRYGFAPNVFDPAVPENRGFCNKNNTPTFFNSSIQIPGCLPKGLLDISRCLPGTPRIYISNAHFFNASPEVRLSLNGVAEPNESNDDTIVELEPTSGVPVFAKRVMQINVGMLKGDLNILSQMDNMIFPVLWINETVYFDDDTKNQLNQLTSIKHLVCITGVSILTVGLLTWFALVVFFVMYLVLKPRDEDEQAMLQEDAADDEVVDS